jgi:hypothetical protein
MRATARGRVEHGPTPSRPRVVYVPSDWPRNAKVTITLDQLPDPEHWLARFADPATGRDAFVVTREQWLERSDPEDWDVALATGDWLRGKDFAIARAGQAPVTIRRRES